MLKKMLIDCCFCVKISCFMYTFLVIACTLCVRATCRGFISGKEGRLHGL